MTGSLRGKQDDLRVGDGVTEAETIVIGGRSHKSRNA